MIIILLIASLCFSVFVLWVQGGIILSVQKEGAELMKHIKINTGLIEDAVNIVFRHDEELRALQIEKELNQNDRRTTH